MSTLPGTAPRRACGRAPRHRKPMRTTPIHALVILLAAALVAQPGSAVRVGAQSAPGSAAGGAAGPIEGVVRLPPGAAKRWASRYPGGAAPVAEVHGVPAVVYLVGDLPPATEPQMATMAQAGGRFVPGAIAVSTGSGVQVT